MANVFVVLPRPVSNGVGASVSTAAMGSLKTIVAGSSGGVYEPVTTVEISNDGGTSWAPVQSFTGPGTKQAVVACALMRMNVSRFVDGTVPIVEVGADDDTVILATLVATAGNGSGAAVDTSGMGTAVSVQVAGSYGGTVNVEISEDTGAPWATAFSFPANSPGVRSAEFAAAQMRITRTGVPAVAPGLPVIVVGSTSTGSGGGGGGGSVIVAFKYTVTGLEPDLTELVIPLPAARANTSYSVFPAQQTATRQLTMDTPNASKTLTQFRLSLSSGASAGDVFSFLVSDT